MALDIKTSRSKDDRGHTIYTIEVKLPDGTTVGADYQDILDYWEDLGYMHETDQLPEDF